MSDLAEKVTFHIPTRGGELPTVLPNLRRITEREAVERGLWRSYTPVAVGNIRVEALPDRAPQFGGFSLLCLHAHDGTGVLLLPDYWAGAVAWYAYGCAHTYVELTVAEARARGLYHAGRCYHVTVCSQCAHVNAYDSSD